MIYKEFLKTGKDVENELNKSLIVLRDASINEDIKEHWDKLIEINGESFKVDVKGLKKQNRFDVMPTENFHWVELENVVGGKNSGWLYGKADLFVFELEEYWVLVDKNVLQEFIHEKIKDKKIEKTKNPYTLYQRENRKDIVTKVKTIDLLYLNRMVVKKIK